MARTSRDTFITWFTDNFLTGNPANITAAKMRDFGNRIADNTRTVLAFIQLTAPQAMVGVNDATPTLIEMDYGVSTFADEILSDTVNFLVKPLLALFYGGWFYDVRGTAIIEGPNGAIVNLGLYQNDVLVVEQQVELKGAGVVRNVFLPSALLLIAAGSEMTLQVTVPSGAAPVSITVNAAALEVFNLSGMP
jgi:hypothetical protein